MMELMMGVNDGINGQEVTELMVEQTHDQDVKERS